MIDTDLLKNSRSYLFRHRTWIITLSQTGLIFCSLALAWLLRFDFSFPRRALFTESALILVMIRLVPIAYLGLLHGWWKYAGVRDAYTVARAVACGSFAFWLLMRFGIRAMAFPRSVYVLEGILTAVSLIGVRLLSRAFAEMTERQLAPAKRVMLIGAGSAAQIILREINRASSGFVAVGCLDDDPSKLGIRIEGAQVLGSVQYLRTAVEEYSIDEVLIAVPSATGSEMQRFLEICNQTGVKFRTVPALKDVISGEVMIRQIRDVRLEDLLGREPVKIDLQSVRREIEDRTILVTGAAGSIGSEVCQQILDYGPRQLVCLDQSETGLFYRQLELSKHANGSRVCYSVADINDIERVRALLREHNPQVVFHVAAYKHVPLMELNVQEAVKNNVFALMALLDVTESAGCEAFVFISSDKAVNPSSVMGATKRIGELILAARPARGMRGVAVRFGNVLGSSGSVVPVLMEQLRNGQPLTVTHPEIRRYFMTISEAAALVLQAFAIGNHGDVLVLDMGQSICIADLARTLIRLSGRHERDVPVHFTGLRAGEKMNEELFYDHEDVLETSCTRIHRARGYVPSWKVIEGQLKELRASMSVDGAAPIRAMIKEIVPQFSQCSDYTQSADLTREEVVQVRQSAGGA